MTFRSDRQRRVPGFGAQSFEASGEVRPGPQVITATLTVPEPYAEVEKTLRIGPDHLIALAYLAASTTEVGRFDAILTARGWRRWVRLPASIEFRRAREAHAVVHLTWRARWRPLLFPVMEADVGLRPVSEKSTELVFSGEYRPPGGLVGLVLDRLAGGRVALSTAEAFLEDLGAAIETDLGRHRV
jgi:hypothetical protein